MSVFTSFIRGVIEKRVLVIFASIALLGLGMFSLSKLPIQPYPGVAPLTIQAISQWPGRSTTEVEQQVTIPVENGSKAEVSTNQILRRRLTITGSTLRPRPVSFKKQITQQLFTHIWPLLNAGQLRPVIYKTFALDQASDAHRLMESSEHVGKIVLTA